MRSGIEFLSVCRPPAKVKIYNIYKVLTKFIVHFASHKANTNSSLSLTQKGGKLVHYLIFLHYVHLMLNGVRTGAN